MSKPKLTIEDFQKAAKRLRCSVADIQAVADVESKGAAYYSDGFPVVLFERHKFYKYCDKTKRAEWSKEYPSVCNRRAGGYGKAGKNQRDKFNLAFSLDPEAAMKACSWGKFQIMGFNHNLCGFDTVGEFVDAMKESESAQLFAFVNFIINTNLADELRNHRWAVFAEGYNGADYRKNNYHVKLSEAHKKFSKSVLILSNSPSTEAAASANSNSNLPAEFREQPVQGESAENSAPETEWTEGERPAQIAENITNVQTGERSVPDNFVPEDKTVNAPPPSGMMNKAAAWMAGLGLGVPSLGGSIQALRNYSADGTLNLQECVRIARIVFKFIFPYAIWIAVAFIAFWGLKEIFKQISLIVKIWVSGKADMNNVEVRPITYQTGNWKKAVLSPEKQQPLSIISGK